MDIRAMKRSYGHRLCLLGNVDLNLLSIGTPQEVDAEVRERRAELFTGLENDRDVLVDRVNQLRDYEENYRRTFNGFLQSQIDQLGQTSISPSQRPDTDAMYGLGQPHVSTPRLDALVDESRQELN